eukprot:404291-Prymnesium_polylepis.1
MAGKVRRDATRCMLRRRRHRSAHAVGARCLAATRASWVRGRTMLGGLRRRSISRHRLRTEALGSRWPPDGRETGGGGGGRRQLLGRGRLRGLKQRHADAPALGKGDGEIDTVVSCQDALSEAVVVLRTLAGCSRGLLKVVLGSSGRGCARQLPLFSVFLSICKIFSSGAQGAAWQAGRAAYHGRSPLWL